MTDTYLLGMFPNHFFLKKNYKKTERIIISIGKVLTHTAV